MSTSRRCSGSPTSGARAGSRRRNCSTPVRPPVRGSPSGWGGEDFWLFPLEAGHYLAENIDGARLVEVPGSDCDPYWEHAELTLSTLEQFLTGIGPEPSSDRALASVLFTDIADLDLQIRTGIHTGEVEFRGDDVGGIGVHIAARVMGTARPGEILVSRTVKDLIAGSGISFEDRGTHDLKGIDGEWQLLAVAVDVSDARANGGVA